MEIKSKLSNDGEKAEDTAPDFEEKIQLMMEIREQVKQKAMTNIDEAQEHQKKNYDAEHQPQFFQESDTVLLRNMRNDARKETVSQVQPKRLYKLKNQHRERLKTSFNRASIVQSKLVREDLPQQ